MGVLAFIWPGHAVRLLPGRKGAFVERALFRAQRINPGGTLGRLPWDPVYLIESLSDSTIYMAYYAGARGDDARC